MTAYGWKQQGPTCAHDYLVGPVLRRLPPGPARILDLGCGNGFLAGTIAARGYEVVGVDRAPDGIALARGAYPSVRFIEGPIDALGTEHRAAYDAVVATEVIEHLYAPRALLDSAKGALKAGGLLILTTPFHGYVKNLALALSGKLDAHFTATWEGGHIKFFSPRTLGQLLEEAGFTGIEFEFVGRLPLLWKSMVAAGNAPARS